MPGGKALFNWLLGRTVPYSGTIRARIASLTPGHVVIELRDRRRVRNHLNSIHAMALANLAELASGLALNTAIAPGVRAILVRFEITYVKKARGRITAECSCTAPRVTEDMDHQVHAELTDGVGDAVARASALWRLGPPRAP
jgi:acyl-coenzyme A thioesterase PaaI-like protein